MEKEVIACKADFKVDTYIGSGPGGQHRNKTQTGVRITHIPSKLVASCCETRSQSTNKEIAFNRLAALVIEWWKEKQDKPEKIKINKIIRSYNEQRNEVKDKRTGGVQKMTDVLDGKIDKFLKNEKTQKTND